MRQIEIYNAMKASVESGDYAPSSRLPSVRTLAKRFHASPNVISRVVGMLHSEGLVVVQRGVGMFIRDSVDE